LEETVAKVASLYDPELGAELTTWPISRSVRVAEAYSSRRLLPTFAPEPASYDYQSVLEELISRRVLR
jgi:hypothetical protein